MAEFATDVQARGAFRALFAWEHRDYAAHLMRLSMEDRRRRFLGSPKDAALCRHAREALSAPGRLVIGWFLYGVLRGTAELAFPRRGEEGPTETAFSVEALHRRNGVGSALMRRALRAARNRGVSDLMVMTEWGNTPMVRLARRFGGALHDLDGALEARIAVPPADALSLTQEMAEQARALAADWLRRWLPAMVPLK